MHFGLVLSRGSLASADLEKLPALFPVLERQLPEGAKLRTRIRVRRSNRAWAYIMSNYAVLFSK
jgi:hypothetical protein